MLLRSYTIDIWSRTGQCWTVNLDFRWLFTSFTVCGILTAMLIVYHETDFFKTNDLIHSISKNFHMGIRYVTYGIPRNVTYSMWHTVCHIPLWSLHKNIENPLNDQNHIMIDLHDYLEKNLYNSTGHASDIRSTELSKLLIKHFGEDIINVTLGRTFQSHQNYDLYHQV